MTPSGSVVVADLDIEGVAVDEPKTDSLLVVDGDGQKAGTVS
jgi:hypothetical protein